MPVKQEATIVVPSDDPKKKKSEEETPKAGDDKPKGKEETDFDELVSISATHVRNLEDARFLTLCR